MTKRLRNDSSASVGSSLKKLCSNPDAMESLGAFIGPRSSGPLNKLRQPSLVVQTLKSYLTFIEQTEEANVCKLKHYFLGSYQHPTVVFYRKDPKLSLEKFLLSLLRDIYDFHMYQRTGTTAKVPLYLFFAEAREEKEYRAFLAGYKSRLVEWDKQRYGLNNSKTKFCRLFDFTSLTDGVKRQDDFFLVLMQYKFSTSQCRVESFYKSLGPNQQAREDEHFSRFMKAYQQFLSGEMFLQDSFTKKLTICDRLYPFKYWREMIFSKYE